jgi:hypothetical protein
LHGLIACLRLIERMLEPLHMTLIDLREIGVETRRRPQVLVEDSFRLANQ